MRTLVYTILILIAAASLSYAQSGGDRDTRLLAKAETHTSSALHDIRNGKTLKRETAKPAPTGTGEDPADTYPAIKNELEAKKNAGLFYNSDSLKAEDLPLVITSADRKTIGVVFPPFLYFKKLF